MTVEMKVSTRDYEKTILRLMHENRILKQGINDVEKTTNVYLQDNTGRHVPRSLLVEVHNKAQHTKRELQV